MSSLGVRCRRVSGRQLDLLWEYLNSHREIAVAFNRSLQAKEYSKQKWKELAEILNSQGEGAHKDWKGWSKYWVDYKAKLKKTVSVLRASQRRTGGGPSSVQPLTDVEEKFLQILGNDYGQGLHGIRVEPFAEPLQTEPNEATGSEDRTIEEVLDSPSIILHFPGQEIPALPAPTEQVPDVAASENTPLSHGPPQSPSPPLQPILGADITRSPRRRRLRRQPPLTQEAARRALVQTSQQKAEAATRSALALEKIAQNLETMAQSLERIETYLF